MNKPIAEPEIACSLNDEEFKERRLLVRKSVLAHVTHQQKHPSGLILHFEDGPDVRAQVENFVALERECCGFLTFKISQPDDGLSLFIKSPEAGMETLERLARAITADD